MSEGVKAFAYVDPTIGLIVDTVSMSELATKINVIVMATYGNMVPKQNASDEQIDVMYLNATGGTGVVVPVVVAVAPKH